jgi:hypothetical protein
MVRCRLCGLVLAALLLGGAISTAAAQEAPTVVTYDQVRAVFKKRCLTCHDADRARGDLDLSTVASIKAGSASGPVVVSGKADESLVYTLAAHLEDPKMPPGSAKIPAREIDLIRGWIDGGLQEKTSATTAPSEKVAATEKPKAAPEPPATVGEKALAVEPLTGRTAVTALATSPTGDIIAMSGRRQIVLLQGTDPKPFRTFAFPEGDVFVLKFSTDGRLLLAGGGIGGELGKVIGFDVESGKRTFEIGDENDVVLAADLSPDGKLVALGGPGKSVKLYSVAGGEPIATLKKHTDWILAVAFSPDGLLLASSDRFGGLQVWEAKTGKDFFTLRGHTGAVTSVNWLGSSDRLLSGGEDGTLRIWDMHKGQGLRQWGAGVGAILGVTVGAKGEIAAGGRDKSIAVWKSIDEPARLIAMDDEISELAFSGTADRVIAGNAAGNIGVFTQATGEPAGKFELPVVKVARVMKPRSAPVAIAKATVEVAKVPSEGELASAEADVARTRQELAAGRDALALTESAIAPTEDSLRKLRESAAKLKVVVVGQERALNLAMERLAQTKTRLASSGGAAPTSTGPSAVNASLEEKQLLLDSAAAFAKQIEDAAARSPGDDGLQAALKLAVELKARLEADVEIATKQLDTSSSQEPVEEVAGNG